MPQLGFGDQDSLRGDIDPLLQGMLVQFMNSAETGFIAGEVAPFVKVGAQEGTYIKFSLDSFLGSSNETFERARNADSVQIGVTASTGTYAAKEYSGAFPVSYLDEKDAANGGWSATDVAMKAAVARLGVAKEKLLNTLLQTTGNWSGNAAGTAGWDSSGSATPLTDIEIGMNSVRLASAALPDTLVVEYLNYQELKRHPQITALLQSRDVAPATATRSEIESLLADTLGIKRLIVAGAVKNNAAAGLTYSGASIFAHGKAWLGYTGVGQKVDMNSAVAVKTLGLYDWSARKYEDPRKKAVVCEVSSVFQIKNTVPEYGYVITGI